MLLLPVFMTVIAIVTSVIFAQSNQKSVGGAGLIGLLSLSAAILWAAWYFG